jgi:hypothetical protein
VVAQVAAKRPITSYTDEELWAIVIENAEREKDNAAPAGGNGAAMPLLEHDDEILPYGKNR